MANIPEKVSITAIQVGDSVSPSIANQPHTDLETNIDNILSYLASAVTDYFGQDDSITTGLTFGYNGGIVRSDNTVTAVSSSTITLPANDTSYIEVNSSGTVSSNVTSFTAGRIPLYQVTTDASTITLVYDRRTWVTSTNAADLNFAPTSSILSTDVQAAVTEAEQNASDNALAFAIALGS